MDSHENALPARAADHSRRRQRRSRIPLSCDPCRTRKLKCNREKPCQNCKARDEQASCQFRGSKHAAAPGSHRGSNADEMRQRIDHLEGLVKKLIAERQNTSPPRNNLNTADTNATSNGAAVPASDVLQVAGPSKTVTDGVRSMYLNANDWQAVLQEINQLKQQWSQGQEDVVGINDPPAFSHMVDGSSLLFSQVKPIEHMEVLSSLPPKVEVDQLVRKFFDRDNFPLSVPPILHQPTFMREYKEHWEDPSRTSLMWLGLLFSILGITMLAYYQHGEPPEYEGISGPLFQLYRMRTAQCLLSSDISKCLPYTVETLRFNATAELNRKDDNRRGLWIMTGVVVRAAINMGYHLDPSDSSGFSVLQAEYRRRTWLSVISMEDVASFLGGFPRTGSAICSNTKEPCNLHDWELSEGTTILPPSRPLTEPTPTTYLIVKGRLFCALGRVAEINSAPSPVSYETVLKVDRIVHDAYRSVPPHMKLASTIDLKESANSASHYSNLGLLCMYHRGMCILHRRFLARGRAEGHFNTSRDRCISSALALLDVQLSLRPYYYRISQIRQMLTLAAMILFLELELRRRAPEVEAFPGNGILLQALEQSRGRWAESMGACDEGRKASEFLNGMLASFSAGSGSEVESSQAVSSGIPAEPLKLGTQFNTFSWELAVEDVSSTVDLNWTNWDAFLEEAGQEPGPIY